MFPLKSVKSQSEFGEEGKEAEQAAFDRKMISF